MRIIALWLSLLPAVAWAERAASPTHATVFIRVAGMLRAEFQDILERSVEEKEVEVGTGSGFVISPYGHILTNYHVISDEDLTLDVRGTHVQIHLDVETIEVVFPSPMPGNEGDGSSLRFVASVDAVDPELDLAVLSVSGANLPYIPLGDSEGVDSGDKVQVFGFPFGNRVEVGRASVPDIVPKVSVSRGAVSAKRAGDDGLTRYLQTTATVNPGNSGGPMVDPDGFALGVIRMKLAEGDGIGFAIPINVVKDFLEAHGLLGLLPVTRMRLGPYQILEGKGLGLRLPESQEDISPQRVRADTGREFHEVPLVIDRVASPWRLDELEKALLSGGVFETFVARESSRYPISPDSGDAILGRAKSASTREEPPRMMEYALVGLENEKLVARFVGRDEQVAFNASVLRGSLRSLEVNPLLTNAIAQPIRVEWSEAPLPSPAAPRLIFPTGWLREEGGPFPCEGLPAPDSVLLTSPVGDFTVSFLAGWWKVGPDVQEAAEACSPKRGSMGEASFASRTDYLGVSYQIEGIFLEREDGILQLELVVPLEKYGYVSDVFKDWIARNQKSVNSKQ
jgi:S1-C subfamily serine protease